MSIQAELHMNKKDLVPKSKVHFPPGVPNEIKGRCLLAQRPLMRLELVCLAPVANFRFPPSLPAMHYSFGPSSFNQYRVYRRSPVRERAPISTSSCRSLVAVARDVPEIEI